MAFFGFLMLLLSLFFILAGIFQLIAATKDKTLMKGAAHALLIGGVLLLLGGTLCTQAPY